MKHTKRILSWMLAAVMLLGCMSLFGCGISKTKDAVDFDTACEKLESDGLTLTVLDESQLGEGYQRGVYCEGDDYDVEFYQMEAYENGLALQQNLKAQEQEGQTVSTSSSISGENYRFERFSAGDTYYILSVIEDTVFLIYGSTDAKDAIKDYAESFGYN